MRAIACLQKVPAGHKKSPRLSTEAFFALNHIAAQRWTLQTAERAEWSTFRFIPETLRLHDSTLLALRRHRPVDPAEQPACQNQATKGDSIPAKDRETVIRHITYQGPDR